VGPTNYADSNIYRSLTETGPSTTEYNPTGWYQMDALGYLPKATMLCPSQDFPGDFDGQDITGNFTDRTHQGLFGVHYSYRYNSARSVQYADSYAPAGSAAPWDRRVFTDKVRARYVLVSDACDYRGVSIGGMGVSFPITETVGPWGYVHTRLKWSHIRGGHLLFHDGSATWRDNDPPPYSFFTWQAATTPLFWYALDRHDL
jgi:hypothetical protein